MTMFQIPFLALGVLTLLSACTTLETVKATQVIVTINSDLSLGSELVRVEAQLFDSEGKRAAVESRSFELTANRPREGETRVPFSFGISRGGSERFLLVVTGYGVPAAGEAETAVVEQKIIASFQDSQTLLLKVFLGRPCFRNLCDEQTTCYLTPHDAVALGECGEIPVAKDLPTVKPGDERKIWEAGGNDGLDASSDGSFGSDPGLTDDGSGRFDGAGVDLADAGDLSDGSVALDDAGLLPDGGGCPVGYKREGEGCVDIDECSMAICGQQCANRNGGFSCSCGEGYKLAPDQRACEQLQWGPAQRVSALGARAVYPSVALSGGGGVVAAWVQSVNGGPSAAYVSSFDGTVWSAPTAISTGPASTVRVASNDQGQAVAVWGQQGGDGRYHLWTSRTVGAWTPAVQIESSSASASDASVTIDSTGNVLVCWVNETEGVGSSLWSTYLNFGTNAWTTAGPVSPTAGVHPYVMGPSSAGLYDGGFWAAWTSYNTAAQAHALWVNRYTPTQGWQTGTNVISPVRSYGPGLLVGGSGDATILYFGGDGQAHATICHLAGGCDAPTTLGASQQYVPALGSDSGGVTIAVWQRNSNQLSWSLRRPGQPFAAAQPLAAMEPAGVYFPRLAVDRAGNAVAVWSVGDVEGLKQSAWYARRPAGGSWSAPLLLQTEVGLLTPPDLVNDGSGRVAAVWSQLNTTDLSQLGTAEWNVFVRKLQ